MVFPKPSWSRASLSQQCQQYVRAGYQRPVWKCVPNQEAKPRKLPSTSFPRVVPLRDTAFGKPQHKISPFVFRHDDGVRYTCFANNFALAARRAGVPFRRHDLRHTFASNFLQATVDIPALQVILGHRSIQMTMRYAHLVTAHLHQVMATFDAKVGTNPDTSQNGFGQHRCCRSSRSS